MMDDERLGLPSASSFWIDVNCPGRRNLIREMAEKNVLVLEDPELAEWARSGSRIHKARETGDTSKLSDWERDIYVKGREGETRIVELWQKDNDIERVDAKPPEQRFWYNHPETLKPLISAQLDTHFLAPGHLLIVDWKSFYAPYVPPSNRNWQLRICALAAMQEYDGIKKIRVALNKPMAFKEKIDYTDLTPFDIEQIERSTVFSLWAGEQPDAAFYPGPHCGRCQCNSLCPAALNYATLNLPLITAEAKDPMQMVAMATPEQCAKVFKITPQIEDVLKANKLRVNSWSDAQLAEHGLIRKPGRKNDRITDTINAANFLKTALMLTDDELFSAMKFTKENLVAVVRKNRNCSEEAAEQWLDTQLNDFIKRDRAKPSVAIP